jgi:VWFA-related protein
MSGSARTLIGVVVAGLMAGGLAARGPGQTPGGQPQPTFRTGVSLVRVDVTVTGRDDTAVADLTADDFAVFEDGVRQTIGSFQFVRLSGQPLPGDELSLAIRSRAHGESEAARDDVRLLAIFLDDYHITREPWVTLPLREALGRWIARGIKPTDVVVLMDPLTPLSALEYTRSLEDLQRRIKVFEGRRGYYTPPRSVLEEAQLSSRNVRRVRAEVTLSALAALVTHLGSLRERRSSVLFVSEGPPVWFSDGDLEFRMREILEAANRSNVTIHTLDPRGLRSQAPSDVLWRLSGETGGRAIVNTNSFDRGLDQVVGDASAYYLLAYAPTRVAADGKFREIDVRVTRKGLRVLARKGYWAPSEKEVTAAAAVETPPPAVTSALRSLSEVDARRLVTTWTGIETEPGGRATVVVAWTPATRRGVEAQAVGAVRIVARDGAEQVIADERVAADRRPGTGGEPVGAFTFTAGAGVVTLAVTVEGTDGAALDRWTERLTVPDAAVGARVVGTPRLYLARSASEWRVLRAGLAGASPTPKREFRRTDRVLVAAKDQEADRNPTDALTAILLNTSGARLVSLAFLEDPGTAKQLELPLASLAPGDYVVRLGAETGGAQQHVAFRVIP